MTKKIGFLEEEEGVKSSTRLFSLTLIIIFAITNIFGFWLLYRMSLTGGSLLDFGVIFLTWDMLVLTGVFAPKYLHKRTEVSQFIETFSNKKEKSEG